MRLLSVLFVLLRYQQSSDDDEEEADEEEEVEEEEEEEEGEDEVGKMFQSDTIWHGDCVTPERATWLQRNYGTLLR